jgi:DNA processing protein
MSVGCHQLLAGESEPALLATNVDDVVAMVGCASDLRSDDDTAPVPAGPHLEIRARLDAVDLQARQVFDVLPARGEVGIERLSVSAGVPISDLLRALTALELAGLVEEGQEGYGISRGVVRQRDRTSDVALAGPE